MDINTQIHNNVCPEQKFFLFWLFHPLPPLPSWVCSTETEKRSKFRLLFDKCELCFCLDVFKVFANLLDRFPFFSLVFYCFSGDYDTDQYLFDHIFSRPVSNASVHLVNSRSRKHLSSFGVKLDRDCFFFNNSIQFIYNINNHYEASFRLVNLYFEKTRNTENNVKSW